MKHDETAKMVLNRYVRLYKYLYVISGSCYYWPSNSLSIMQLKLNNFSDINKQNKY